MKLLFSKRQRLLIGVILLFQILCYVFVQFFYLNPLKTDLDTKKQSLTSEQKLLEVLSKNKYQLKGAGAEQINTSELQKELPVKPLQDQVILDLEQAEAVSNSQIKSMTFTQGDQGGANNNDSSNTTTQQQLVNGNSNGANQKSGTSSDSSQQNGATNATAAKQQSQTTSSNGINKVTVQLNVESPSYRDFEKFVNAIESLKRITVVEAINYTASSEITTVSEENKPFTYTLTVSSYYLPGLTDIEKQLPKVDYPAPANKENPLSQFANTQTP